MANFKTSAERQAHWDAIYAKQNASNTDWDQQQSHPSLDLIAQTELLKTDRILDVGTGSSLLIKHLLERGYENLLAADISEKALSLNKQQIGKAADKVTWLLDDLTNPQQLHELDHVALWHDRSVFHYITDFKERLSYFSLMNRVVREEGCVILAASNEQGEATQSGLAVRTYNLDLLQSFMGPGYYVIDSFNINEKNANGDQEPMLYALFKRVPYVTMK
jgi:SAM-dependent methyltransferase